MMTKKSIKYLVFSFLTLFLLSCSKTENITPDIEINNFVWGGMNAYYKWQGNIEDLSDRRFSSRNELNGYLSTFENPANLFNSLLDYKNEYPKNPDKVFSWITDDYPTLLNALNGTRVTSGIKIEITPYQDGSENVYAYVKDVIVGSDADAKGIKRGMIFNKVNGEFLTQNNYQNLFNNSSYSLTLADSFNNGNPIAGNTVISLVKSQIEENPVKITKVIEQNDKKIGYLMYNQFSSKFDGVLNQAFADFKTAGITDLIVDLRYNGGGSVRTAVYLASMITGQFNKQLFSQQIWNQKVMSDTRINQEQFKNYFTNKIENNSNNINEAINSVGMSTVYFIVTNDTASASELVINGLKPYVEVKLTGNKTVGKQVGSITLFDGEDYTQKNINQNHTWAMQPIVLEITNKDGENNPQGYTPDIQINEDPANLGVLGDINEPLLARTLAFIKSGNQDFVFKNATKHFKRLWNPEMTRPDYQNMYVDLK